MGVKREASFPSLPTSKEEDVNATHSLMQFWWAPKDTPIERISYLQNLIKEAMKTDEIKTQFKNLHLEPIVQVGKDLLNTIDLRSKNLENIYIEKPTTMPPPRMDRAYNFGHLCFLRQSGIQNCMIDLFATLSLIHI